MNDPRTWLTAAEAGDWLRISTTAFNRLVSSGYLPPGVMLDGVLVYCPKGIRAEIQLVPIGLMQPFLI